MKHEPPSPHRSIASYDRPFCLPLVIVVATVGTVPHGNLLLLVVILCPLVGLLLARTLTPISARLPVLITAPVLVITAMITARAALGAACVPGFNGCPQSTSDTATLVRVLGVITLGWWTLFAGVFLIRWFVHWVRHEARAPPANA